MSEIIYRLDLVINLIDTTTGKVVDEKNTRFYQNGVLLLPEHRGEGIFVLLNTGREDFHISIDISGYERYEGDVCYQDLNENLPIYAVYLIPKENLRKGEPVISYQDRIPKLEAIEAITLMRASFAANEYNKKKQELTIFRTDGNRSLSDVHYGLLQGQKNTYTHIEVEKDFTDSKIRLSKPIEEEFRSNTPVYRIIFGQVSEDGAFMLRVRDSAKEIPVIIRFCKENQWYSLKGEFHSLHEGSLEEAVIEEMEGGSENKE